MPLTYAGVIANFSNQAANRLQSAGKRPFYHAVAASLSCRPFTREFQTALDSIRDSTHRSKRWIDQNLEHENRTLSSDIIQKIRFSLDADQIDRPAIEFANTYTPKSCQILREIDSVQILNGAVLETGDSNELRDALKTLRLYSGEIDNLPLRDHVQSIINALEYSLNNVSRLGPTAIISYTSALFGALTPVAPDEPKKRKVFAAALSVVAHANLLVTGVSEIYTKSTELIQHAIEDSSTLNQIASDIFVKKTPSMISEKPAQIPLPPPKKQ